MAPLHLQVRGSVEQRRATASMQSSAGAVVKALLGAKASGELPGVFGRLGAHALHAQPSSALRCACLLSMHMPFADAVPLPTSEV